MSKSSLVLDAVTKEWARADVKKDVGKEAGSNSGTQTEESEHLEKSLAS